MFIATIPNRKSPPAILLRESYREGTHVRSRTLANFSYLSAMQIGIIRGALKGEAWVRVDDALAIEESLPHGHVRPMYHRTEPRVGAHLFVSMLAFYVEWHMREALKPLLFEDEDRREVNARRDPVAAARPSASARRKKQSLRTQGGQPAHSFRTLLEALALQCKNRCRFGADTAAVTVMRTTETNAFQAEVFEMLKL